MRSSIIIASFAVLAAALPAIVPVEKNSLTVRTEPLDATVALEARQVGFNVFDQTYSWPDTEVTGGGMDAEFQATNQGNGKYKFQFWNASPLNGDALNFRVSYGGKTLASVDLAIGNSTTVVVPKTGDNFNIFIQEAA